MARGVRRVAVSTENLMAAIPHVAHDALLLRLAFESRVLRVGWTTWFVMARNLAIFFEVGSGGRSDDIRASQFFVRGGQSTGPWVAAKTQRLAGAPPALATLHGDASQAVAHLSWRRVHQSEVQTPSREITRLLLGLWSDFAQFTSDPYRAEIRRAWRALHRRPQGGW
jgi:hypothetical protein